VTRFRWFASVRHADAFPLLAAGHRAGIHSIVANLDALRALVGSKTVARAVADTSG
jgi:hypothetical protein